MVGIGQILEKTILDRGDICLLLAANEAQQKLLFTRANEVKKREVGNKVFFRGLIEFSNICAKDCLYCGIRKSNHNVSRYNLTDEEIIEAACYALTQNYSSIVLQSGELVAPSFTKRIDQLIKKIAQRTNGSLRITLSLGEQSDETFKRWFESGAQRYLIRMETSNRSLYNKIHPMDDIHSFDNRLRALESLKKIGYQTGTGVMIGLPFQTIDDLAGDLLFMKEFGIDMVGMGPYIEHQDTPLYSFNKHLISQTDRFFLALKMIAVLRLIMPNINIAAATALQAIDKMGREKALMAGANIIMPNITPGKYRDSYKLYDNKPCINENADDCTPCLEARIAMTGNEIGYGEWGDSKFFQGRLENRENN
jgi:biotin synthase